MYTINRSTELLHSGCNDQQITGNDPANRLPPEVFSKIILILSDKDAGNCASVCHKWRRIVYADFFLKEKYLQNTMPVITSLVKRHLFNDKDAGILAITNSENYFFSKLPETIRRDFQPLVEEGVLNCVDVAKYASLSFILRDYATEILSDDLEKTVRENNPELRNAFLHQNEFSRIVIGWSFKQPYHYAFSHNKIFTVSHLTDIQCQNLEQKDSYNSTILKGEDDKVVCCLTGGKNNLYALRADGVIVRWDVDTLQIQEKISTRFSSKKFVGGNPPVWFSSFHVMDQYGIMTYVLGSKNIYTIEIIDLKNPKNTHEFTFEVSNSNYFVFKSTSHAMYDNKLYVHLPDRFFIWNMISQKEEKEIPMPQGIEIAHFVINNDNIYFSYKNGSFGIVDLKSKKIHLIPVEKIPFELKYALLKSRPLKMEVIDDKIITFNKYMYIFDFKTLKYSELNTVLFRNYTFRPKDDPIKEMTKKDLLIDLIRGLEDENSV